MSLYNKVVDIADLIYTSQGFVSVHRTLQWIRIDAPIIIHLDLSKCLRFLVKDTHYRNLFETGKGGGGNSTNDRKKWEVWSRVLTAVLLNN